MSKYRVKKITRYKNGDILCSYMPQIKYLFCYHNIAIESYCSIFGGTLSHGRERKSFSDESDCRKAIEFIKNPYNEVYKGNHIKKCFYIDKESDCVYINLDDYMVVDGFKLYYTYSCNLSELKKKIDDGICTNKVEYLY